MDKNFIDFSFDGRFIGEYNLVSVSNGDRYTLPLSYDFSNSTTSVPGRIGGIYWGTEVTGSVTSFNLATDSMTSRQFANFKGHFKPGKIGKLFRTESAYKYSYVMIDQRTDFSFLPFEGVTYINGLQYPDSIYKGDMTMNFFSLDGLQYCDLSLGDNYTSEDWFIESGLPLQAMLPSTPIFLAGGVRASAMQIVPDTTELSYSTSIPYYNAGTVSAECELYFTMTIKATTSGVTWNALTIGNVVLIKNRSFKDIDYTLKLLNNYSSNWTDNNKQIVLNDLRENLDSPMRTQLIGIVQATGTGLKWGSVPAAMDAIVALVNNVDAIFAIDGIKRQSLMHMDILGYDFGDPVTQVPVSIDENVGDSTSNQYIEIKGSEGILPNGSIEVKELLLSGGTLKNVKMYFSNTYV